MANPVLIPIFDKGFMIFICTQLGKEYDIKGITHGVLFSGKFVWYFHSPPPLDISHEASIPM